MSHPPGPDIRRIRSGNSAVYLVSNGSRSILVDAGMQPQAEPVLAGIAAAGLAPTDIALIVLTHTHKDHAAGLPALKQATGAPVLVHAAEAAFLRRGFSPFPGGATPFGRAVAAIGYLLYPLIGRFTPFEPDIEITARFDLSAYDLPGYLLPTPGHTLGSTSLILDGGAALVGDAMFGVYPRSAFPPFACDVPELLRSWQRLLDTRAQVFYPGHGRPVTRQILAADLAAQLARQSAPRPS
jgi:hydroxyacylglutathione hydrolase